MHSNSTNTQNHKIYCPKYTKTKNYFAVDPIPSHCEIPGNETLDKYTKEDGGAETQISQLHITKRII